MLFFLLNQKVDDTKELTDNYTLPVLSAIKREKEESEDPGMFMLNENSSMDMIESYAKLRMNLLYTLVDKEKHTVIVTSAISGEGKSTIAANLAISVAMSGKRVLLVDADIRRACQHEVFHYDDKLTGLSDVLVGSCSWQDVVLTSGQSTMNILPAGSLPPNPAELLDSPAMHNLRFPGRPDPAGGAHPGAHRQRCQPNFPGLWRDRVYGTFAGCDRPAGRGARRSIGAL